MRPLYLIRHASPVIQPTTKAAEWALSERGIGEARALGAVAAGWKLSALYCSGERKALAMASIIGDATDTPPRVVEGLEELRIDRWIDNADEFSELVREILDQPDVHQRGCESAEAAAARFGRAVAIVETGTFPAAIVSHGRIITAWLREAIGLEDPFRLWRSIGMPGWCCVDLDDLAGGFVVAFGQ